MSFERLKKKKFEDKYTIVLYILLCLFKLAVVSNPSKSATSNMFFEF